MAPRVVVGVNATLPRRSAEEYTGVLFVQTLIAGSGRQKPGNPAAIAGRLIDSGETERRRAFVIVSFTEFIT